MKTTLIPAANDTETAMLANAAEGGSPFAILQPDGFLVPFGEFPHKQGLQLFDRAAAEEIVKAHNSALSKLTRWVTGGSYPVYVGHPDLPGSKDSDKRAYGWIENMRVTPEGLHLSAKWSDAGRELVENAHFKFYSPLWWTKKVKGGIRPIALKSMGLTNDPNIPVPALANEAAEEIEDRGSEIEDEEAAASTIHNPLSTISSTEPTNNTEPMNPEILAALGLEEGATPEEVLAKITALQAAATDKDAAENKATEADTAKADAEAKAKEYEEKKTEAENELATANDQITALESDLTGSITAHVVQAQLIGRITPAEVPATVERIMAANDKPAELTALYQLPAKFKTESKTGALGEAKSRLVVAANDESAAARNERAVLVANEYANTNPALGEGARKRIAWERARKKNPEVFGDKKESSGSAA